MKLCITQCNKSHKTGKNSIIAAATDNAKQLSMSICLKTKGTTAYKKSSCFGLSSL
jgi:hypothetical protein